MGELKTGFGDPTHEGGDMELHEVTVSGGSTTLNYDHTYEEPPALIVTSESGDGGWSARGTSQATITATADDTAFVLVVGDRV